MIYIYSITIMAIEEFQGITDIFKKTGDFFKNINKKEQENTDNFLNTPSTQSFISYLNTTYSPEQLEKELWSKDVVWYINKIHKGSLESKMNKILHTANELLGGEIELELDQLKENIKDISFVSSISEMISGQENSELNISSLITDFVMLSTEEERVEFLKTHWISPNNQEEKIIKEDSQETSSSSNSEEGIVDTQSNSNTIKENTNYTDIVESIIENIEWWYYHPNMNLSRMGKSWETMMGIDRVHWGNLNTSENWKKFWSIIDQDKKEHPELRKHNYKWWEKEKELRTLAGNIIEPHYKALSNKYLSPESLALINKDWRLLFNFIYCAWNGAGWFKKFADQINDKVATWETNTEVLYKHIMDFRKHWTWNSLISQWGKKIEKIIEKTLV